MIHRSNRGAIYKQAMAVTSVFPIEKNRSRAHNQIRWAAGLMPAERIDAIEL
jgi:hypothetical protein